MESIKSIGGGISCFAAGALPLKHLERTCSISLIRSGVFPRAAAGIHLKIFFDEQAVLAGTMAALRPYLGRRPSDSHGGGYRSGLRPTPFAGNAPELRPTFGTFMTVAV